jgi:hypothetical protein
MSPFYKDNEGRAGTENVLVTLDIAVEGLEMSLLHWTMCEV